MFLDESSTVFDKSAPFVWLKFITMAVVAAAITISPESTWMELTYAFRSANQVGEVIRTVFARAFERWLEVMLLNFTETTSYAGADIKIGFYSGDHGDGEPFDGVLGTLAHAFSPPSGNLHLDDDENWVTNDDFLNAPSWVSAVDLESMAVHEIGHLLGLGHSSVEESIMYPSIPSATRRVELTSDDIQGIQVLYGQPEL